MPEILKKIFRYFRYKNERKKVFREFKIRRNQNELFKHEVNQSTKKLILFLVDGASWFTGKDEISGGILSIASIYKETLKLKKLHDSDVIMCTMPEARHLLQKHTQFPNDINVYRFNQLKSFKQVENLIVHIPEYRFKQNLVSSISNIFDYITPEKIHLNILNQRIDIMPPVEVVQDIKKQGYKITQTTAHEQYSTQQLRDKYNIPLHKFSVYATPNRYPFSSYQEKENLILVSPDPSSERETVLKNIQKTMPDHKIVVIQNMPYTKYLSLIKKAKFMITFGEGLDFYFVETVFSGGISFAVYNENFFTSNFHGLKGLFQSEPIMSKEIGEMMKQFNNGNKYQKINQKQFSPCQELYNDREYHENLMNFYKNNYLFP